MARSLNAPDSRNHLTMAAFVLSLAGLYFAREVLIPLSLAGLFTFLLTPAVRFLEAWKLPRIPAVILVLILAFSVVGFPGWIATNQLIDVLSQLPNYKNNIHNKFEAFREQQKGTLAKVTESVKELSKELSTPAPNQSVPAETTSVQKATLPQGSAEHPIPVQMVEPPATPLQSLRDFVGPLLAPIATAFIVLVFTIVMLIKREDLRNRFLRLLGQDQIHLATEAIDDATQRVSRYLRMQFLVNAAFGTLITVGLYFIGLPNALLWGVLAGALRFVPYVGAIIGGLLPLILSLAISDSWQQPLLCFTLFLVAEPLVAYLIEPALYGTHTGISALAILVAAAVWTTLWGPVGLILSTPLTVCLVVIGRHVPQLEFLHVMLGDEPVFTPATRFYQRLLALDQQEAQAVIDGFLKERTVIELYDEVLIPALSMAEEDRHKGTLDETREHFLLQSLEEFVTELSDVGTIAEKLELTTHQSMRVICIPSYDKADEISAVMLAQVCELAGYTTMSFPLLQSPAEILTTLSLQQGDIVCISALPPFALMNARTLSKQLRAKFPEMRIILGLWNFSGGGAKADERLGKAFAVDVVTTLAQALESIESRPDSLSRHENPT